MTWDALSPASGALFLVLTVLRHRPSAPPEAGGAGGRESMT
ncbi:MAG: hypothetical protein ACLSHM_01625 [Vescimonas sp.]